MRSIRTALGIAGIGLLSIAAPIQAADWGHPQSASTGNLTEPSMVEDRHGHDHVVARGDTGLWYVTDKSGSWVRTRMTRDVDSTVGELYMYRQATHPLIAVNDAGTLTVVYSIDLVSDVDTGCYSKGLRYTVRSAGSWSKPKRIPDTQCQVATGIVVKGAKIYLATFIRSESGQGQVEYVTNASGSWTHATVASGSAIVSVASLATYDGKPMLAYIKGSHLIYARGQTSTGSFVHETAATTGSGATSEPSVAINEVNDWPMIAWAQADGTHYAYRNAQGWSSYRVMKGSVRALLEINEDGRAHIAAADGAGGLWYGEVVSGAWHRTQLDAHTVSDLGGMGSGDRVVYLRGTSHLYAVFS